MDIKKDQKTIRTKQFQKFIPIGLTIIALIAIIFVARYLITPSMAIGRLRIATVELGMVESTITATGVVVPEFEQVISCPFDTRIVEVLEEPGASLVKGQPVLKLDDRDIAHEVERLQDEIALKVNEHERLEVDFIREKEDLVVQMAILKLRIEHLEAKTHQQRELFEIKAATSWSVRQAELDENISRLQLEQMDKDLSRQSESVGKQVEGLEIEARLLGQRLQRALERLDKANVTAMADGVLTWISDEEGATLREGEIVARIANLTSYRVEATVSDIHAARIKAGMFAHVKVGQERLTGIITSIPPNITGGVVTLIVSLDEPSHSSLRSNLRVDVYAVTEHKDDVLRIKKGPFINGSGRQEIFVINESRATKVKAQIGLISMDYYEIVDGLFEGDKVIISDMSDRIHLNEFRIRR
jgi:HlyD family secretion protein